MLVAGWSVVLGVWAFTTRPLMVNVNAIIVMVRTMGFPWLCAGGRERMFWNVTACYHSNHETTKGIFWSHFSYSEMYSTSQFNHLNVTFAYTKKCCLNGDLKVSNYLIISESDTIEIHMKNSVFARSSDCIWVFNLIIEKRGKYHNLKVKGFFFLNIIFKHLTFCVHF